MTQLQVSKVRNVPEDQVTFLDVKFIGDVADLELIGYWQQEKTIAFDVEPGSTQFDSRIEGLEFVRSVEGGSVEGNLGADLARHAAFLELDQMYVGEVADVPAQQRLPGKLEVQSVPSFPGRIPLELFWFWLLRPPRWVTGSFPR